jgi:hypothetical protein
MSQAARRLSIEEAGRALGVSPATVRAAFSFDHHFQQYGRVQVIGLES